MKPHEPLVSVIIVAQDHAREIDGALASLVAQTYENFEVLVVDDGSTDGTSERVQHFRDERVRLVRHVLRRGMGMALQTGAEMARGRFIALLDPDARALPQRLAMQVAAFEADPQLQLVGSHLGVDDANGQRTGTVWRRPLESDAIVAELLLRDCLSGVMLRSSAWPQTEPCLLPAAHAYWLNANVAAAGKLANIDAVLTCVRRHAAPQSRVREALVESCVREVMRMQIRRLGIEPSERELMLNRHIGAYTLPSSPQLLHEVEAWLIKLFLANCESGRYPARAFNRMIGCEWYEVCKFAAPIGKEALQTWRASPLLKHWFPSVPERARFIAKCLLRHEREGNVAAMA